MRATAAADRSPPAEATESSGYIIVTFRVYPEGDQYVSECLELGTASCGDTIEEAFDNIDDATHLYLNAIEANGERERIFREKRIPIYPGEPDEGTIEAKIVDVRLRDRFSLSALPVPQHGPAAAVL